MKTKPTNYERATMKTLFKIIGILASTLPAAMATSPCYAGKIEVSISGREAIFLAGRYEVTIPPLGKPGFLLERHGVIESSFLEERFPTGIVVRGGDTVKVLRKAGGGIDFFFDGSGVISPEGGFSATDIPSLGGISGYSGLAGALTGVFLGNANPAKLTPPPTLVFGVNQELTSFRPMLGQIFFIGDGITSTGALQKFIAPIGATRLFLGVPDSFNLGSAPGAYEDNKGEYRIVISVSQ